MNDKNIVLMQAAAAILMGSDYFTPKDLRERMNKTLRDYFSGVKSRAWARLPDLWTFCMSNKWKTIYPVLYAAAYFGSFLGFGQPALAEHLGPAVYFALSLVNLTCLMLISTYLANDLAIVFLLSLPTASIAFFLEKTEKGPVAAIGFMVLMMTFYLRYQAAGF